MYQDLRTTSVNQKEKEKKKKKDQCSLKAYVPVDGDWGNPGFS